MALTTSKILSERLSDHAIALILSKIFYSWREDKQKSQTVAEYNKKSKLFHLEYHSQKYTMTRAKVVRNNAPIS